MLLSTDPLEFFTRLSNLSGPAIFCAFLFSMWKGWIVWGREKDAAEKERAEREARLKDMQKERDEWKHLVIEQMRLTAHATNATSRAVSIAAVATTTLPTTPN